MTRSHGPIAAGSRAQATAIRRAELRKSLTGRFWLRFHATLIASATFAVGLADGLDVGGGDGLLLGVLALVVLAIVFALAGSAVHFVWIAPELLTDAAFAALLTSGAYPGLRRVDDPGWKGRLFSATWKPLLAVVVVATLAVSHFFPDARTLGEAWRMLS